MKSRIVQRPAWMVGAGDRILYAGRYRLCIERRPSDVMATRIIFIFSRRSWLHVESDRLLSVKKGVA
jgi:hypothetical protein